MGKRRTLLEQLSALSPLVNDSMKYSVKFRCDNGDSILNGEPRLSGSEPKEHPSLNCDHLPGGLRYLVAPPEETMAARKKGS
jgi:hypothetical protein